MLNKGVLLTVFGRVQGVGFRYSTVSLAKQLGIKGTVRNDIDGSVVIQAVGEPKALQAFIDAIHASPSPYGRVQDVVQSQLRPLPDFSDFRVIG